MTARGYEGYTHNPCVFTQHVGIRTGPLVLRVNATRDVRTKPYTGGNSRFTSALFEPIRLRPPPGRMLDKALPPIRLTGMRVHLPAVGVYDRLRRFLHGTTIYRRTSRPVEVTLNLHGLGLFAHFNILAGLAMRLKSRGRPFRLRCITANYALPHQADWLPGLLRDREPLTLGASVQRVTVGKHSQVPNRWAGEVLTFDGVRTAFFEKYAIEAAWCEQADEFAARHFRAGETLGIHYRGTDKESEAPRVTYEAALARVRERLASHRFSRLFVATDEAAFVAFISQAVSIPVLTQSEVIRASNLSAIHLRADRVNGFKKAVDALTDCLLLARCDHLIKTASALSGWAALINPSLPIEFLNTPHASGRFFPDSVLLDREPPARR